MSSHADDDAGDLPFTNIGWHWSQLVVCSGDCAELTVITFGCFLFVSMLLLRNCGCGIICY